MGIAIAAVLLLGTVATVVGAAPWQRGWGRHGPWPGRFGPGMGYMMDGYGSSQGGQPLSIEEAARAVDAYLASMGSPDLAITEVMEFDYNFYAEIEEKSTGIHAFELLVGKDTGRVYPEPGPNMMWNTKYGHHWGMMGRFSPSYSGTMSVSEDEARAYAQRYLDRYLPGTTVGEADAFYGYYTLHTIKEGQVMGMLSVNGYTGQVWYHGWHGAFVRMLELE